MRAHRTILLAAAAAIMAGVARADTLEDRIAAVNATLAGNWSGHRTVETLASGALEQVPVEITYTLFSDDGLSYAYWNDGMLSLSHYQGNGRYRIDVRPVAGDPYVIEYQVANVSPPDDDGNWTVEEVIMWPQADGTFVPWPQTWSMTDGELATSAPTPQPGVFPPRETWSRGYRVRRDAR